MGSGRSTVAVYFAIVGGALLVGLLLCAPWPLWASLVVTLALVTAVVLLVRFFSRWSRSSPPEPAFTYAPLPPQRRQEHITDVRLPSNRADYFFLFSATVLWLPVQETPDEPTVNMAALAVDAVVGRAGDITSQRDPYHAPLVQRELGGALGTMYPDATGCLRAMAESVRIVLSEEDQQRLDKLATVRKKEAVWEHERKHEQNKREYLGGDALKDPGSAVVWWLARNDDQVDKTVHNLDNLARLSAAANNTEVPESFLRLVSGSTSAYATDSPGLGLNGSNAFHSAEHGRSAADHFDDFVRASDFIRDDTQRCLFAHQVASIVANCGGDEVAHELRRRFDSPDDAEAPDGTGYLWEDDDSG